MGSWVVVCGSCTLRWPRAGNPSEYEREAIESRPCPRCGAYTLNCSRPSAAATRKKLPAPTRRAA